MKIIASVRIYVILYHSVTMRELKLVTELKQEIVEGTKEFDDFVAECQEYFGYENDQGAEGFDFTKKMVEKLSNDFKQMYVNKIKNMEETFKQVHLTNTNGIIKVGGTTVNPKEFCAFSVNDVIADVKVKE